MSYTISQRQNRDYPKAIVSRSVINRFLQWCVNQDQEHHIAWAGISLISMSAVFFPLTMAVILSHSASFGFIIPAMVSLILVFTLNLAAQPTRYTIPALVTAILIDLLVIIGSLFIL